MWIGGGMGTGMGIIDFQWEFIFVDELNWDAQRYLDIKAIPVFLSTMAGFLVGGILGSKFGSQRVLLSAVGVGTLMTVVWSASRSNWSDELLHDRHLALLDPDLGHCWCKPTRFA